MKQHVLITLLLFSFTFATACTPTETETEIDTRQDTSVDREQLLNDIRILSSDEFEGRRTGEPGNELAQSYITERFESLGLLTFGDSYHHYFDHTSPRTNETFENAVNLIGYVEGSERPDEFIVVTAHYDHFGVNDEGEIFNGADDNASGTAALMAAAAWFSEHQPETSIMFIGFDAEEQGLGGAYHFADNPVVPLENIIMNINMDMISLSEENEIFAVGTYHYPFLRPMVEAATADANITVSFGYDEPDHPERDDWTMSSDHGPFHAKEIPFIYFGVEDHPHYHQPSDIFENITPDFYYNATVTIVDFIRYMDEHIETVKENHTRE